MYYVQTIIGSSSLSNVLLFERLDFFVVFFSLALRLLLSVSRNNQEQNIVQ